MESNLLCQTTAQGNQHLPHRTATGHTLRLQETGYGGWRLRGRGRLMKGGIARCRQKLHACRRQNCSLGNRFDDGDEITTGKKRVAPEFGRRADRGRIAKIDMKFGASLRCADIQCIEMNMRIAGNVQPAGMGVQQRNEALQERQRPYQQHGFAFSDHGVIVT